MSLSRIRELFKLSPVQQIRHWAEPDPWEKMKFENKTEIGRNSILLDADCNIIRMPLFMKPCFGQPTAFVRHGGPQPLHHPRFGTVPSRCMRCKAKEACEAVANKRIYSTTELKQAYVLFGQAGGAFGLKNPSHCPTAKRQYDGWVRTLCAHGGFKSVNDAAAIAQLDLLEEAARRRDAEKKRLARRKAITSGDFSPEFLAVMEREADYRARLLIVASLWDRMPPNISKITGLSSTITADVWLVKECMRLRGQPINPSSVAREMAKLKPSAYPVAKHNSLRQRVQTDLARVSTLERFVPPGHNQPLWPRFDLVKILDELDRVTPYTP